VVDKPLSHRRARFVEEYLLDLNATRAACRAGYHANWGYELLKNPGVARAVDRAIRNRSQRCQVTQDMVLSQLARIAFVDPRSLMDWGPDGVVLKPSSQLSEAQAASVREVSETATPKGPSIKLATLDRVKALELLGKHLGLFTDKTAPVSAPELKLTLHGPVPAPQAD
jgi:phage terminase small subunit